MSAWRHWTHLFCLWLSIATVFAHAVLPIGSPLTRSSGSAFSASTSDVSLGPARRGALGKHEKLSIAPGEPSDGPSAPADFPIGLIPTAPESTAEPGWLRTVLAANDAVLVGHVAVGFQPRGPPFA